MGEAKWVVHVNTMNTRITNLLDDVCRRYGCQAAESKKCINDVKEMHALKASQHVAYLWKRCVERFFLWE
jgi:hypothetical protein